MDIPAIKRIAKGRWHEVLPALTPISVESLTRKRGSPCPACGGTDRFFIHRDFDETGGVGCRHCFASSNADGIAAVQHFRGCGFTEAVQLIAEYVGLEYYVTAPAEKNSRSKDEIATAYDYVDETGQMLFQVCRTERKRFLQRRPDGNGGWIWNIKGSRVVPFLLDRLVAQPEQLVVVVEGEKDAAALNEIGILATCNAGGAGKWTTEHSQYLAGRDVGIIPDNDPPGRSHAEKVADSLNDQAKSVRIVNLPDLPVHGDVSDWLEAGGTRESLLSLMDAGPLWTPAAISSRIEELQPGPILACAADIEPTDVDWLWPSRVAIGRLTLLVGRPGEGKSLLTLDIAAHVTTGTHWTDGTQCASGKVIVVQCEDDPSDTVVPRLTAAGADLKRIHFLTGVAAKNRRDEQISEGMFTLSDGKSLRDSILRINQDGNSEDRVRLIVVDPVGGHLRGTTDAHRENEVRAALAPVAKIAAELGVAVMLVAHRRKQGGDEADALAMGSRAFTGIARSVWHLSRDSQDHSRRLLLPGKANLVKEPTGLAFTIEGDPPQLIWEPDAIPMTADAGLVEERQMANGKRGPDAAALKTAILFLESSLANGPRPVKEVEAEARDAYGIKKRSLERARTDLGVIAFRDKVPGRWKMKLPDEDVENGHHNTATPPELKKPGGLGGLAKTPEKEGVFGAEDSNTAKFPYPREESGGVGNNGRFQHEAT